MLGAVTTSALQAAVIGHWQFEDSPGFLSDSSSSGNTLTAVGSPTQVASPFSGEAASLGGSDAFTASGIGSSGATAFTFEAYINISAYDNFIGSEWGTTNDRAWAFEVDSGNSGQLRLVLENPDAVISATAGFTGLSNIALNTDYYIAAVFDGAAGEITFYAQDIENGGALQSTVVTSGVYSSIQVANTNPLGIGFLSDGTPGNFTSGIIDEVRLSNTALTQGQLLVAIPEPSTVVSLGALAVLSSIVLMRRRRR